MATQVLEPAQTEYRNFNICPHCERCGMEPTLSRISETMPMISRSDGRSFHLLLADRPVPYPAENDSGPADGLSLCFWYSCIGCKSPTQSTVVLLSGLVGKTTGLFRQIEFIADLLVAELQHRHTLPSLYALQSNSLREIRY